MTLAPIAAADSFTVTQGLAYTLVTGNLGADNGAGIDYDPDGSLLGFVAGTGFTPIGDGDRYLGAFFSGGTLGFLMITGTVSYPFPIFVRSTMITTTQGGSVSLDTSGNFSYHSVDGFSGTDSFTYTLVDADFQVTTATVTFNITPTAGANDRPVAADDQFTLTEDSVLTGSVLADNGAGADSDPNGDALSVQAQTLYSQAGGIVHILADGSFTYTPKANYHGVDGFDYTLLDPQGASDRGHVTLTVTAVNDAPVAMDDRLQVIHDRTAFGNVLADNGAGADRDADGDALTVVAATLTTTGGALVVLNADGSFTYQPAAGHLGADFFDYSVTDPSGATDSGRVNLTIVNHAPVAANDTFYLGFGMTGTGNLLADNGSGADSDADGDSLSLTAGRYVSEHGSVLTVHADGHFGLTPGAVFYGVESFAYQLSDSLGATTTGMVQFIIAAPATGYLGTAAANAWTGSDLANDTALLGSGNDTANGLGGNDLIGGGANDDSLYGGIGNDRIYGEADKDVLDGGDGKDALYGGAGADLIAGGLGNDRIFGGAGHDKLRGGAGADQFIFLDGLNLADTDRIADFGRTDHLVFGSAALGLGKGSLPDASYLANLGAADAGHGRFVYDGQSRSLYWDADGAAATSDTLLTVFDSKVSLTIDCFLLV